MDNVLKVETAHIDTNPYGYYKFSADYFRAADHVYKLDCGNRINYSGYFLFTRSIELMLKSVLLASKVIKTSELKTRCKHDLDKILKLLTPDLKRILQLTIDDENNILVLNRWYKTSEKKFEYYSLSTAGLPFIKSTYPQLPDIETLRSLNLKFFSAEIEKYILSSS